MFSQTKFVILSELPALLLYVQSSSFTLQFAMTFGLQNSHTDLMKRKAKCNLDLERIIFFKYSMSFQLGCLQAWQKARKTAEFFQVLLQIQLLRDTQKYQNTRHVPSPYFLLL